jgi:hypothetical protein
MPQFSLLRVRGNTPDKPQLERYLDFRKFPQINLATDLAAASLYPRTEDAVRHAAVYYEELCKNQGLINSLLGGNKEITVVVDLIHYTGEYVTSLGATTEVLHKIRFVSQDFQSKD